MKSTDKAVEVSAPGILRVVERSVPEPGVGQAGIRCGSMRNLSHRCGHCCSKGNQKIQVDLAQFL